MSQRPFFIFWKSSPVGFTSQKQSHNHLQIGTFTESTIFQFFTERGVLGVIIKPYLPILPNFLECIILQPHRKSNSCHYKNVTNDIAPALQGWRRLSEAKPCLKLTKPNLQATLKLNNKHFNVTLGRFPAVFVSTKAGISNQNMILFYL